MSKKSSNTLWIVAAIVSVVAFIGLAVCTIIRYREEIASLLSGKKDSPLENIEITDSDI